MVFIQRLLHQGSMKHKLETFRLKQLGHLLLHNPVAFPSRLHPHRSIKPATDFTGAECVPCTMTYPFAKLDKGTSKNQESYTYRSLQKNALRRQRV